MKNVMIVDGADNCAYDIYAFTEDQFDAVFSAEGQDIAFIDEVAESVTAKIDMADVWTRPY